ncbi:putative fatty acyl-CoA reductase CG5065 [Planococcus citri]|uniref:putative fatty acyl-CoA reductase CG5065 n=1 Tax=Planococcus citri TaxID=170843 RepID=UPI0031F93776
MSTESDISKFYAGQKILITGVSGFIGKVLLWKLLHSCPNVDTIYILIRAKKGQNINSRAEKIFKYPIYNNFRNENPKIFEKVSVIAGDISAEDLDLSEKDRQKLIDGVTVVFHIAAALNMDADLKSAVNTNCTGTLRLLKLCTEMKHLKAFLHTSTTYCYCDKDKTREAVFPPMEDPYDIMHLVTWVYSDLAGTITPSLIKPHPNTYTYTKRLAEKVVSDFFPQLPIAIVRPSIVIPSIKEPLPGWVDSLNGPVGLLIAGGKGVMRSMLCDGDTKADVVAVDVVANSLIAVGWKIANEPKPSSLPVYNASSSEMKPLYWKDVVDMGKEAIEKYPFEKVLWYPTGGITSNETIHVIISFIFQWIPAYFIDFIMTLIGQPRFLVNVQKKIYQGQKVLQYFTTREWHFDTENMVNLKESMNSTDQEIFPVTMKDFKDRTAYMDNAIKVARHYILKEDPASIPQCQKKMRILYILDCFTRYVAVLLLFWIVVQIIAKLAVYYEFEA